MYLKSDYIIIGMSNSNVHIQKTKEFEIVNTSKITSLIKKHLNEQLTDAEILNVM